KGVVDTSFQSRRMNRDQDGIFRAGFQCPIKHDGVQRIDQGEDRDGCSMPLLDLFAEGNAKGQIQKYNGWMFSITLLYRLDGVTCLYQPVRGTFEDAANDLANLVPVTGNQDQRRLG